MNELKDYIEGLELSENDSKIMSYTKSYKKSRALESEDEKKDEAFLNFKSLNSFVSGISKTKQDDVLNSMLLAQRAAEKAFPNRKQVHKWYNKYFEILEKVGWVIESNSFKKFDSSNSIFEMDKAILEIIGTALTGNQLAVLIKTIDCLKKLNDNDSRFVAFERNTHALSEGSFQLGVASEVDGVVSIYLSAFTLSSDEKINKLLFFKFGKDNTSFEYNALKMTMANSRFDKARQLILEKLDKDVDEYISRLEI